MVFQTKRGSSSLRRRLGARSLVAVSLCVALASVGGASIATGAPVAQIAASPLTIAKKALRIARGANKRSKRALSVANQALSQSGQTGPKGDKGDPGADGADGKTVLSGAGAPDAGLGADGDFYIDTTTNEIYGPKTAGAWGSPTSLVGPQGIQGIQGIQGDPGPKGDKGDTGDPWTAGGTLPSGETETGAWTLDVFNSNVKRTALSLPIPLAASLPFGNVTFVDAAPPAQCDDGVAPAATAAHPEADAGHMCVFLGGSVGGSGPLSSVTFISPNAFPPEADVVGATGVIMSNATYDGVAWGSFAVTAP